MATIRKGNIIHHKSSSLFKKIVFVVNKFDIHNNNLGYLNTEHYDEDEKLKTTEYSLHTLKNMINNGFIQVLTQTEYSKLIRKEFSKNGK